MGFRFRRSIKLAPGLRMKFSTRGIGLSAGVRGARVSVSSRGLHSSVGVPGTGIWYGGYAGSSSPAARPRSHSSSLAFQLTLKEDGTVAVLDNQGQPHSPRFVTLLREKQGDRLERWLAERCDYWNEGIDRPQLPFRDTGTNAQA